MSLKTPLSAEIMGVPLGATDVGRPVHALDVTSQLNIRAGPDRVETDNPVPGLAQPGFASFTRRSSSAMLSETASKLGAVPKIMPDIAA